LSLNYQNFPKSQKISGKTIVLTKNKKKSGKIKVGMELA
jgi:hypothetical protein